MSAFCTTIPPRVNSLPRRVLHHHNHALQRLSAVVLVDEHRGVPLQLEHQHRDLEVAGAAAVVRRVAPLDVQQGGGHMVLQLPGVDVHQLGL